MQNILIAIGFLLISPADLDPAQEFDQPSTAQVQAEVQSPSAHRGVLLAFELLQKNVGKANYEVLAVHSKVQVATPDKPAHVQVDLDMRFHADGGAAAQAAFDQLHTTMTKAIASLKPTTYEYQQNVGLLVGMQMENLTVSKEGTSGTHGQQLRLAFPSALVAHTSTKSDPAKSEAMKAKAAKSNNVHMLIRQLAANEKIQMSPVNISMPKVGDQQGAQWLISFPTLSGQPEKLLQPLQLENLLHQMEAGKSNALVAHEISFEIRGQARICKPVIRIGLR